MIELVPAIDIIQGKCVRLSQGDYDRKTEYSADPLEVARQFEGMGLKRLHLVDLDGARAGRVVNLDVLERISAGTSLLIDFGGGIKTDEDLEKVFGSGAGMITAGSIAVKEPERVRNWIKAYGPSRIILGADVREGKIAIHGWQEDSSRELESFIRDYIGAGMEKVICTDISVDGMLSGPSLELYAGLRETFPELEITASGGVSGMDDVLALEAAGIDAVIFGKAFYEGKMSGEEIKSFMKAD